MFFWYFGNVVGLERKELLLFWGFLTSLCSVLSTQKVHDLGKTGLRILNIFGFHLSKIYWLNFNLKGELWASFKVFWLRKLRCTTNSSILRTWTLYILPHLHPISYTNFQFISRQFQEISFKAFNNVHWSILKTITWC